MTDTSHTPLPWIIDADRGGVYKGGIQIRTADKSVDICQLLGGTVIDKAEQFANAEMIVAAVNERESLKKRIGDYEAMEYPRLVKINELRMREREADKALIGELVEALKSMIRLSDMGFEESMKEPEENGNYVSYNKAKTALAKAGAV